MNLLRAALRTLFLLAVFLAALVGSAYCIGRVRPYDGVPMVNEKWAFWEQNKEEFDTIFIGTSRTYRGIIPKRFDELTAAAGVPTHSFNFGVAGMHAPEDGFMAEQLLEHPPRKLKHVFLEVGVFMENFTRRDPDTLRAIYWHDWKRTRLCVGSVLWPKRRKVKWSEWLKRDEDGSSPISVAAMQVRGFFLRSLSLGRGADAWNKLALMYVEKDTNVLGWGRDGFRVKKDDGPARGDALAEYLKRLGERKQEPSRAGPMNTYSDESLRGTVSLVRAAHASPYILIPPTTHKLRGRPSDNSIPVFDLCDMDAYPELFVPENRTDYSHVNYAGAEILTRLVAEKFIAQQRPQNSTQR